ncbi:MAG: tetratricopeptide repeat protein [Candidatus Eremiobacteraeota bacterium]|nr:tetratricopeptide repeat protein [Candidatus Eremiobacteraeota bacterium]
MRNEQTIKKLERIVADEPSNHEALFQLGRHYIENDDLNGAIYYLEKALTVNPNLINARYELAVVFSRNFAYEYAVKEWQKIVDEDGDFRFHEIDMASMVNLTIAVKAWERYDASEADSPYKHFTLGFIYYCLRMIDKSISQYIKAVTSNDKFEMAHYFLGLSFAEKGDFANAFKAYSIELTLRPQSPNVCYHLGMANYRLGKIQQAVLSYQKAIQYRPRYLKANFQLGISFSAQGLFPQAEKAFKLTLDYKPNFADAHLELGKAYHKQYRMDEAAKEYELAIRSNPRLKEAAFKLGELKKSLGKMDEAVNYFQRASELDPTDGDIYYYVGSIYSQQKKFEEAVLEFRKALNLIPNHDFAIYALGEVLFNMGELDRAIEMYKRGLQLNPNDNKFRNALGKALFRTGDLEQAICEFQKVLEENPKDAFSHYYLGLSLFKTGKIAEAAREYQRSVESNPNSAYAHFCLGASYSKNKEFELAVREFEKATELMPSSEAELALFGTLQLLAAIGIEHAQQGQELERRYIQIREVYRETVKALANAIDARDPYTRFHSARVSRIAKTLAIHIRNIDSELIPASYIEDIEIGGLLHDVGKIAIPDYIVRKEAALTDEEMAYMRKHPLEGEKILKDINFPWQVIPLVRHHHEKYNGRGYPDGLFGESIPFGAMIICIADVYDALVTNRPYRKAYSAEQALGIITKGRGTEFAEGIVDAFIEIVPTLEPLLVDITQKRDSDYNPERRSPRA